MAATETDFTNLVENGDAYLAAQWPLLVRAMQSMLSIWKSKVATGTEPSDNVTGYTFGDGTAAKKFRLYNNGAALYLEWNTGTDLVPVWTLLHILHNTGDTSWKKDLVVGDLAVGEDRYMILDVPVGKSAGVTFRQNTVNQWTLNNNGSSQFSLYDRVNDKNPFRIQPGDYGTAPYGIDMDISNVYIGGASQLTQINGNFDVNGSSNVAALTATAGLTVTGALTADSGTGAVGVTGDLTVANQSTLTGAVTAVSGLTVTGALTADSGTGAVGVTGDLTVGGLINGGIINGFFAPVLNYTSVSSDYTVACGTTANYYDIIGNNLQSIPFPDVPDGLKRYMVSVHLVISADTTAAMAAYDAIFLLLGSPPALDPGGSPAGHASWLTGTASSFETRTNIFNLGASVSENFTASVSNVQIIPLTGQTLAVGYGANLTASGTPVNRTIVSGNSYVTIQRIL